MLDDGSFKATGEVQDKRLRLVGRDGPVFGPGWRRGESRGG